MPVVVERSEKFAPLYNLPADTSLVICIGGRGGMKTYEVSKFVAWSATIKNKRCCILRDEKELIRESILNEILLRYDTANENGSLTSRYDRLDTGIKSRKDNKMVVFTKGFRASSNAKSANLKGASDIDIAVVEEAEDIRDEDKFNTFQDSLRKESCVTVVILNTPDVGHWIVKRYFTTVPVKGHDGYFKIVPKKIPGVHIIQSSYKDNRHLPARVVERYKAYGDPNDHRYNLHYYLTAICGYATTGRKGQVIKKAKPITLKEYHNLPYKEMYGQDFGTSAPAGLVGVKAHRNKVWVREINYKPKTTLEIAKMYCDLGFNGGDVIVCDHADKNACDKLEEGWKMHELSDEDFERYPRLLVGFNIVRCQKGRDSVTYGVDNIDQVELFVTEDSDNYWHEIANYIYNVDKNGNPTNDPIDEYNHLIDPTRYVLAEIKKPRAGPPQSI